MKKGKSRNKRKKTRSRLLWIAIAVIGIAAVISAVCVAGMLATKENAWWTPEELLVEYMDHIPKQEYEEMYAVLHIEASGNVSQEDFVTRNSAIYEGIEVQNMAVQIIAYDEEQMAVTYQTSFDTVAGTISYENEALFLKGEDGYKLVWDDSMIFPNLTSTDKVRVSTTQAERGEILDRNGCVLAGKGIASSVGIVPGKLENREEAIAQIAELLETTPEAIEKNLSAQWVKDDSFVPIKTIPRVEEIKLMKIEPDEEVLKEKERHEKLLEIPGVMISDVEVREYPLGETAAHLVGYMACIYSAFCNEGNVIKPYLVYQKDAVAEYWIPGAFSNETASRVLEGTKKVVNDSNGTGYAAHRDDILLAGKTGTAEIKASKDDTSGTELGWFAIFTAEDTVERPILIISMVEDVKGRGGSGYVVKKDNLVLEEWFGSN
ncbi:NTF2-like N-terminal transpeptidase domain-containing protein [Mediterraneibacter agrestimuris]|uniref:NTF2-like N-terminal transpeptidase domain-containing protein n=1 Tax=Mediterraneibacter agrestimuris TaxID=2941333 RepID=UPI00203C2A05|nr:NTF2-like N-terminal transpeptidase domain-containing protein [Mediterraneibacter agrestimuris]